MSQSGGHWRPVSLPPLRTARYSGYPEYPQLPPITHDPLHDLYRVPFLNKNSVYQAGPYMTESRMSNPVVENASVTERHHDTAYDPAAAQAPDEPVYDPPAGSADNTNNDVPLTPTRAEEQPTEQNEFMSGWKLYMLTAGIWISLFLSTLETTIVSTSLIAISDSLSGFELRNWVVTAYFLTYTGFLVIYAKLASIFGSKTMFIFTLTMFTVFSIGCGSASTMEQLIILRAFQGIGGSGIYSMVLVIAPALVPKTEYGKYIGIISSVFALASITGPLVGGAISSSTSWRWVFLLNGPPGFVAILLVAIFLPASKSGRTTDFKSRMKTKFSRETTRRVDFVGAGSLLGASVLLVFALESGGTRYAWDSSAISSTFIFSGILWIVFIVWEIRLEQKKNMSQEPIFIMGLLKDRQLASMMFTTFFIGFPFVTILFIIPQRAQAVYGLNPVQSSLSVLPLLLTSPFATAISGVLTSNYNVPPAYLILIGSVIQLIGVGLSISIPLTGDHISASQYGFEAVMGVGFGLTLSTVLTLGQLIVSKENAGIVMGALTQIRVLGGTIALAICSAVLSNDLRAGLAGLIKPDELGQIAESLSSINDLDPERAAAVRLAFATGYKRQFQILTGFSGLALLAALFLFSRNPVTVKGATSKEAQGSSIDSYELAGRGSLEDQRNAS